MSITVYINGASAKLKLAQLADKQHFPSTDAPAKLKLAQLADKQHFPSTDAPAKLRNCTSAVSVQLPITGDPAKLGMQGPLEWNGIDMKIRNSSSSKNFKNKYKKYLLSYYV